MAESYRGLTIRIGGDTSSLVKALRAPNQAISQTQAEIRKLGQALKLDPGNVQVISTQMGYMANQATNVSMKLAELKRAQEQIGKLKYTADDGSVQTVREMARATEEYGGAVSNVSEKLASNRTELSKLTVRLAEAHNNMTNLTRTAASTERTKIGDAFNLAAGITSVDELTKKYSQELPNGMKRSEEQVRQIISEIEKMRDAIGFKDGTVNVDAIVQSLRDLPEGISISSAKLSSFSEKLAKFNEKHHDAFNQAKSDVEALTQKQEELQSKVEEDKEGINNRVTEAQLEGERLINEAVEEGKRLVEDATQATKDRAAATKAVEEAQRRLNEAEANLETAKGEEDAASEMVAGVERVKAGLESLSDDDSMGKLVEIATREFDGFVDHVAESKKELLDAVNFNNAFDFDADESVKEAGRVRQAVIDAYDEIHERYDSIEDQRQRLFDSAQEARKSGDQALFEKLLSESGKFDPTELFFEDRKALINAYSVVADASTRSAEIQVENIERVKKAYEQVYMLGGENPDMTRTSIDNEISASQNLLDEYKAKYKDTLAALRSLRTEYLEDGDDESAAVASRLISDLTKQRDATVNAIKAQISRLKTEKKAFDDMLSVTDKYEAATPVEVYDEIQQKLQDTKALRDAEKRSVDETTARLKAEGKSQQEVTEAVADGVDKVKEFDARIKDLKSDLSAVSGGRGANLKGAFTEAYEKQHSNDEARESARAKVAEEQAENIKQAEQELDEAREQHSKAHQSRLKAEEDLENARAEAAMKAKAAEGDSAGTVEDAKAQAEKMRADATENASKMVQDAMQAQDDSVLNLIQDQIEYEQTTESLNAAQATLADTLDDLAKLGGKVGVLSGEMFKNAEGNTNVAHMDEILRSIAENLGISGNEIDEFVAKTQGLVDGFNDASTEQEKLLKVTRYQDLVSEIMKSEAAVKSLAEKMSGMNVPSELMRGMYELVEDTKTLDVAYRALTSTGSSLSQAYDGDSSNVEAATQAMNAYVAAEAVAAEKAELLDKELSSFDFQEIDGITDHTKSATLQLMEASKAAVEARQRYDALMGEFNANEEKINQLKNEPAHISSTDADAKKFEAAERERLEAVKALTKANEELESKIRLASEAEREANKNRDDAKKREEYENAVAGVAQWRTEMKKASEAARELFVKRSLAETFGDTSSIDRLQERVGSLTSSANAFKTAFEFDPKNVDMATASMARLQEAEDAAAKRMAELGTKASAMDTSRIDELREKYGSIRDAVDKTREAVEGIPDVASKLSAVQTLDNVPSYLDGIREKLLDPTATFKDYEIEFLPKSIADAHRSLSDLREVGVDTLRDLADAEKALKFEQMQQEIAAARMELEKLMRQEHEIVVRLSLQGEFGDTTKITDALDGAMQSAMGRVGTFDNALKFDTKNVDLLDARMRAVTDAMNLGAREADALRAAIAKIDASDVEEMRTAYGSTSNAVRSTTEEVETLISKVAEAQAEMDAEEEGTKAYDEAREKVERLREALDAAEQSSAKAAKYEQWERYNEQLAKVSAAMHGLNEDVREVAERNVEAFSANYSEGMFGDVDEQVASFDAAIQKAEERYRKYTDALAKEPHNKLFKDEQAKALAEAVDLTNSKVAYLKQTMSQFDQSKISALKSQYGSFGKAVDDSKLKLKATEAEIETLRQKVAEFAAKNGKDAAWVRQFTDAKAEIKSIPPELAPVRARIVELFDVQGGQQLELAIASVCSRLEEMGDEANVAQAALRKALEGDGTSFIDSAAFTQAAQEMGQWARQAGQHIVDSANTIDSAYRDMRKTVNGTEEEFESIRQAAIDFSQTHAVSADQMLEMEALGGQLGVVAKDLEQFGRLGSNISIATDIEANDAALQLGQMQNIMSDLENMDDLEHFGDALVRLGNNAAAQESAIMNVAQRIAAVGNVTSMSASEVLGWSAAIAETGQRSESAATALQRTITGIGDAVNKGGSTLKNFAAIANMSTDEFKAAWENSSSDALKAFIVGLEGLTDSSTAAIQALDEVNISSVRQETALLALSQTVDNLDDNITMSKDAFDGVSDEWGAAGDAAREAQNKSEGFSGSLTIMQNNINNLAASLGDGLKPFLDLAASALRTLTDLINSMPPGVKSAVVTLGGLSMIIGTAVPIINQFRKGWVEMAQAMSNNAAIQKLTSRGVEEDTANTVANTEAKVANTAAMKSNTTTKEENAGVTKALSAAKKEEASAAEGNSSAMAGDTASTEANTIATTENAAASEAAAAAKRAEEAAATKSSKAIYNVKDAAGNMAEVVDDVTDAADAMGDVAKGAGKAGDAAGDMARLAVKVDDVATAGVSGASSMTNLGGQTGKAAGLLDKASSSAGGLISKMKGMWESVGPIVAIIGAVEMLIEEYSTAIDVVGNFTKSLDVRSSLSDVVSGIDTAHLDGVKKSLGEVREEYRKVLDTIGQFADSARNSYANVEAEGRIVDQYAARIQELSSLQSLNSAEQAALAQAVDSYNEKTGASVQITNAQTGELNLLGTQINEVTEAYKRQLEQAAYADLYKEAIAAQAKAQMEYDQAVRDSGLSVDTFGQIFESTMENGLGLMGMQKTAMETFGHVTGISAWGAKDALDEAGRAVTELEGKMNNMSFSYGNVESAMASAGLAAEQYASLTDEQKNKLAEIQAALINAGHSLADYKDLTASQLAQIVAAWTGSVPGILKSIKDIQTSTKAATESNPPTVDYTAISNARKKELDKQYNEQKKAYDAEYKQQQKALDKAYKAAQKASQKYLKDFKKAQSEEVDAFKAATDAKVKEIEREYEAKQKLLDLEYEKYDSDIDDRIKAIEDEQDAEDEARKQKERQEKLDELNKKVATARTNKARKEAEKELNDYLDDLRAEDTKKQRDAQIQKLKDQKSSLKDQYDDRKAELKESYDLAVSSYKAEREAELKLLQEKQEAEYEMVSESEQAKLEAMKEGHQNQLEELKNHNDEMLEAIKEANDAEVQAIRDGNAEASQAAAESAADAVSNIENALEEAASQIPYVGELIKKGLVNISEDGVLSFTDEFRKMPGVTSDVLGLVASTIENEVPGVSTSANELADSIVAPFGTAADKVVGSVNSIGNYTAAKMGIYASDSVNAFANGISDESALTYLMQSAQALANAATEPASVMAVLNERYGKDSAWALAAGYSDEEAAAKVREATDAIVAANGDQLQIMAALDETYGKDAVTALANGMSDPDASAKASDAMKSVKDSTMAQVEGMPEEAEQTGSLVPPALASGMAKLGDKPIEAMGEILKYIADEMGKNDWSEVSGNNLIVNFARGMASTNALGAVANAAISVANLVASYLHHSTPDKGPLRYDDRWGGEMVDNWVGSMRSRFGLLEGTTSQMAGMLADGMSVRDANADFMQSLIDDMRSKEGELLRQAQRMAEIVERGFDPELTVDAAYEAIDRIDRGRLRRQQMVASSQSVDNSTYAPVININIPEMVIREEADIDRVSNQIAVKVQRQLNSRIG